MGEYRIPLIWQLYGHVNVTAASLEEAIEYALGPDCPLPDGEYIDDSVAVDEEIFNRNLSKDSPTSIGGGRNCC